MRALSPDELAYLLSVLAAGNAAQDISAWRDLRRLLDTAARADPSAARLLASRHATDRSAGTAQRHELALSLLGVASYDSATEHALGEWLHRHRPPGTARAPHADTPSPEASETRNVIGGDSVLHGPSVQARDIQGGIHFHPPSRPAGTAFPLPRQLPPVTARFVDREADRRTMDALRSLRPAHAPQVLVVSGPAGVGKTTFAAHWLFEHIDDFPDGQLYADLVGRSANGHSGPVSSAAVLEGFLVALGVTSVPVGTAQRSALWRSVTSELRLAVLLDSAFTAAQVRPLLLGTSTGLTLVTSRSNLTGLRLDGASVHRLEGLPAESALELLAVGGGARVAREAAAANDVVRLCGRLPLTVTLASAQLALRPHRSVAALAEGLARDQGSLDTLRVDGEAVMSTALDMSYELLPREGRALYRRLGLLPADRHDLALLAALAGDEEGPAASDHAALSLVEANLLEETGPETYRFHDLVQPHARRLGEELAGPGEREGTLRLFVDWCLATAACAEGILTPSHRLPGHDVRVGTVAPTPLAGPEEALGWLSTHRNGLMGAVRHTAATGLDSACWRLTDLMWPLFLRLRPSEMWLEAHHLGLEAARRSGSRQGEGRMLTSGAIGLRDAGRFPEAADWYRRALELATADGDLRQQGQVMSGLGHVLLLSRQLGAARDHFEQALALREAVGYRRGAALSRRRLGETALAGGDLTGAATQLSVALAELHALGETYEATRVLALLGHVLERDGKPDPGVRHLYEALARFREGAARSEHWEARCLEWLGEAAESGGDHVEAERRYEAARDLYRRLAPEDAQRLDDRLRRN